MDTNALSIVEDIFDHIDTNIPRDITPQANYDITPQANYDITPQANVGGTLVNIKTESLIHFPGVMEVRPHRKLGNTVFKV